MRNGAARLMPMNSMPKYMARPNAANVAIIADRFPKSPSHGFDRTTSPIMHVIMLYRWGRGKLWIFSLIFSHICVSLFEYFTTAQWMRNPDQMEKKWNGDHSLSLILVLRRHIVCIWTIRFRLIAIGRVPWNTTQISSYDGISVRNVWCELTWMLPSRRMSMKNMAQRFVYSVPIRGRVCVTQIGRHLCA